METTNIDQTGRSERLQARVNTNTKSLIEHAASLRGISVSDFLINSAYDAATKTIEEYEVIHLNQEASKAFFDVIENPPEANEAFRKASKRYAEIISQ